MLRGKHFHFSAGIIISAIVIAFSSTSFAETPDLNHVKALIRAKNDIKENPDSVQAHREYQKLMIKDGWRDDMIKEYTKRAQDNRTPENLYLSARIKGGEEEYKAFKELTEEFPDFAWGLYGYAYTIFNRGEVEEALKLYERVVSLDPNFVEAYRQLMYYYTNQNDIATADEWVRAALDISPNDADLLKHRGYFMMESGYFREAEDAFRKSIENDPTDEAPRRFLASTLVSRKKFDEAVAICNEYLSLWPDNSFVKLILARVYFGLYKQEGDLEKLMQGEAVCRELSEKDPPDVVYDYTNMYSYFSEEEWWVHALFYNNRAFELSQPDSVNYSALEHNTSWIPANQLTSHYTIEALRLKDYINSEDDLSETELASIASGASAKAWQRLGTLVSEGSTPQKADLDSLIEEFPKFAPLYYNRGILEIKYETGLEDLKKAVSLTPEWGRAHGALAASYIFRRR
ncbi:MAG: tetratricopeptide repeat protein [Candidatus Omnitrophota bacterium]|nr:tetratricopeptide repeat protein [Candidatus Omnitrophota bacterium]